MGQRECVSASFRRFLVHFTSWHFGSSATPLLTNGTDHVHGGIAKQMREWNAVHIKTQIKYIRAGSRNVASEAERKCEGFLPKMRIRNDLKCY